MPIIDHNINIQRIIDVILADTTLFDSGKTIGLLRAVNFGDPSENIPQAEKQMPYAYITTSSDLQETSPQIGVSNTDNVKSVTVQYKIVIVAQAKDRQVNSQKQLYELVKNMRTLTELNPTFLKPVSNDDPVFVRSIISDVNWDEQSRGNLVTVISMTLLATIGALFFLTVPGITDPIPLISKPIDRDIDSVEDILDDGLILKDTAVIKSKRTISTEFESTAAITSALRTIKDSRSSDSFTITSPTGNEIVTAYVTQLESSTGFSDMETSVIQLDVVNP